MTDFFCHRLVDGNPQMNIGTVGFASAGPGEKSRVGPGVIPAAIVAGGGIFVIETAKYLEAGLHGSERLHGFPEHEIRARVCRPPVGLMRSIRKHYKSHAQRHARCGSAQTRARQSCSAAQKRGQTHFQERQGDACTHPPEKLTSTQRELTVKRGFGGHRCFHRAENSGNELVWPRGSVNGVKRYFLNEPAGLVRIRCFGGGWS